MYKFIMLKIPCNEFFISLSSFLCVFFFLSFSSWTMEIVCACIVERNVLALSTLSSWMWVECEILHTFDYGLIATNLWDIRTCIPCWIPDSATFTKYRWVALCSKAHVSKNSKMVFINFIVEFKRKNKTKQNKSSNNDWHYNLLPRHQVSWHIPVLEGSFPNWIGLR